MIDIARLEPVEKLAHAYRAAQPFPHTILDDFLEPRLLDEVIARLPPDDQQMLGKTRNTTLEDGRVVQRGKRNYTRGEVDPLISLLFNQLNDGPFLQFLEQLSGIPGLTPDPMMRGAGLQVTDRGGLLAIHADFNYHPVSNLERRINLLLYLNPDWLTEYGGELELWDQHLTSCQQRIAPIANRCVIFSTSSVSYHGHPWPLNTPAGMARKSLAMYYYSDDRPKKEQRERHATVWPEIP